MYTGCARTVALMRKLLFIPPHFEFCRVRTVHALFPDYKPLVTVRTTVTTVIVVRTVTVVTVVRTVTVVMVVSTVTIVTVVSTVTICTCMINYYIIIIVHAYPQAHPPFFVCACSDPTYVGS